MNPTTTTTTTTTTQPAMADYDDEPDRGMLRNLLHLVHICIVLAVETARGYWLWMREKAMCTRGGGRAAGRRGGEEEEGEDEKKEKKKQKKKSPS
ncbi:hypothetical protein EJ03DRAFT_347298 [Teratosphaeria nubilosa]|uniref:Uncharacterized protein n=1 Tax=Teratosphaeria nubilosa TaxID=161662 RepID=A0A6G1LN89_9PEZI|nr:hypothetical protein EJ03DRAFT_347298 [Teratosphaeria nubilosa]